MKYLYNIFAIAIMCLGLFSALPAKAQNMEPTESELAFIERINEARLAPLTAAAKVGLNPAKVLADFPEMREILITGLSPLVFDENLYRAATGHTSEMFEGDFYASVDPEGKTVEDRIEEAGYIPETVGENLGMLAFINLVRIENAVDIIFANMYRDELDPKNDSEWNILNPSLEDVAVSLQGGIFILGGKAYNVYLTTCDFAEKASSDEEYGFLALVNQARLVPLKVAESMELDTEQLLEQRPVLAEIFESGLPPLIFEKRLHVTAEAHSKDMLENNYFSHESLDGRTLMDRIVENGYSAQTAGEILGSSITEPSIDKASAATDLFDTAFKGELKVENSRETIILGSEYKKVGISLSTVQKMAEVRDEDGSGENELYHLVVGDFASPANNELEVPIENRDPYIFCVVFGDANDNGLFDIGEGLANVEIAIYESEGETMYAGLVTNGAGVAQAPVLPGGYVVVLEENSDEDATVNRSEIEIVVEDENVGLYIRRIPDEIQTETEKP